MLIDATNHNDNNNVETGREMMDSVNVNDDSNDYCDAADDHSGNDAQLSH